ncbi:LysE family translocator [Mycobacterium sp. 3519A]|uniref:LysE family translocator n=1 Tax=Mycobacterium sp. 3519A TaxID=2057184 RepID=UPI000C7A7A17|nr:LysE family translocator [Mycobacterium sp. 3519A]
MVSVSAVLGIAAVAFGIVLIPGPNMFYLASRSISQGRGAGLISLAGVAVGFGVYLVAAVAGLATIFAVVPVAYTLLKVAGGVYLLYLAWQALRPGGSSPFSPQHLNPASRRRLFSMGLVTNLLNPKIAVLYVSLLPQFVQPGHGSVALQSLILGGVQISIALVVNGAIVWSASGLSVYLAARPRWMALLRRTMGTVLAGFAVKLFLGPSGPAATG